MVAVGYPWLRAVQQSGKYDSSIEADLSAFLQMPVIPHSFVESAESAVCLDHSVIYFSVDLGIWCDGTPQISEMINYFELSYIDDDVGRVVLF